MIGVAGRRKLVGGGSGALPSGPYYTENSAIYHVFSDRSSSVFHASGGLFGTVDTTLTAVVTANAGGTGIHAFNPSSASSVKRWSRFVAFPGTTLSTYSVDLKNHASDSGKKVAIAIWDSSGAMVAHTVVTLTGTNTTRTVSFATTPGNNYYCGVSNEAALGADADARAYVGVQTLTVTGATGTLADFVRLHIAPAHWLYNLETFAYPPGGYWAAESNVGQEASTHAFLAIETNASEIIVETMSTMYQAYITSGYTIAASTGVTVKVDGVSYVDVKSTADGVAQLLTVPLPGALANLEVYNVGRNAIAAGWVGSHYRAIYFARGKAFTLGTQPAAKARVVAAIGDSLTSGFAGQPMAQYSWAAQLRTLLDCDVYDDGTGGIIAYAFSGASCQERADKIATCNPTDITFALGTNDWQQENAGLQSLDNDEIYIGALIDALHATIPGATIHILRIWNKTTFEGTTNGQGHTLDDVRNRLTKLVVDRGSPSWLRLIEVVTWTTYSGFVNDDYKAEPVGMINDLVHYNNTGSTKVANKLAAVIPASKLTISPATATYAHSSGAHAFSASGGSGAGRVFALWKNASGGSINASTGAHTPGAGTGEDVISVTDSHGQQGFAVVTVT